MKEKLLLLIREVYKGCIYSNLDNKTYNQFEKTLKDYIKHYVHKYKHLQVDINNLSEELYSESKLELQKSFKRDSVWEKRLEQSGENDRKLWSYLHQIIDSCSIKVVNQLKISDSSNLYRNINNIIKELVENKIIIKKGNGWYTSIYNKSDILKYDENIYLPYSIDICDSAGRINVKVLKDIIEKIFDEFDDYKFKLSDIMRIIQESSGYSNTIVLSIDDPIDEEDEIIRIETIKDNSSDECDFDKMEIAMAIYRNIETELGDDPNMKIKLKCYLLSYQNGMGLVEIEKANISRAKKSQIANYIKEIEKLIIKNIIELNLDYETAEIILKNCIYKVIQQELK